jgi:hypothetical protein
MHADSLLYGMTSASVCAPSPVPDGSCGRCAIDCVTIDHRQLRSLVAPLSAVRHQTLMLHATRTAFRNVRYVMTSCETGNGDSSSLIALSAAIAAWI